tara:strand:- start:291 stop:1061 length:771 start_codon:yes stop_codon:yes gene_type:complete
MVPELIVLLPTKNEEDGIGEVIDRIPRDEIGSLGFDLRVVVIDGASTDSTCEIAVSKGAELIRQRSSPGKGWGFREAIQVIFNGKDPGEDLLIMLDSDATYYPEDIPRFINELRTSEVVWGSRLRGEIEEGAMSRTNKLGNKLLSLAASLLFMKRTTDLCTGFWGFRSISLEKLPLSAKGFNLEAELFSSVNKFRMKTIEIPINYANREGVSNLKWYVDGPRIFLTSLKKRFEYTKKPVHDLLYISCFAVLVYTIL